MVFLSFLLIGYTISLAYKIKLIRENFIFPVIAVMYAVSFLPSLTIPYIIDDLDHLYFLSWPLAKALL